MPSYMSKLEEAVFQSLLPQLEAEGFQTFVHPQRATLPPFLKHYQPDAVAYKGDKKIAIEVMSESSPGSDLKIQRLRILFSDHPDWELRFVYAPPPGGAAQIPVVSKEHIEAFLDNIEARLGESGPAAALLTAWAALEAAARLLMPTNFGRAQTTSRLVEALASEGYVTPDEADMLRELSKLRNQVAHGQIDLSPRQDQIHSILNVGRSLLRLAD